MTRNVARAVLTNVLFSDFKFHSSVSSTSFSCFIIRHWLCLTITCRHHSVGAHSFFNQIVFHSGSSFLRKFLISGRSNFSSPLPNVVPTIEALKKIPVDWSQVSVEEIQKFREEWTGLFKKKD